MKHWKLLFITIILTIFTSSCGISEPDTLQSLFAQYNLKAQGQYYYNLINGLLQLAEDNKVEMDAITFWGFTDKLSWRAERNPSLFNNMYQPKYAYYGAMQLKESAGFEK